nr:phosphate/phosphite/phosphonate ABC transporter substrate-binding protein [Lysobacter tolerans]
MSGLFRASALCMLMYLMPPVAQADADTLVLGQISDDPKSHYQRLKPLLDYVVPRMKDVGITQGRILMAKNDRQMASYLRSGRVDWVTETAASGILLRQRASAVPLLRTDRSGASSYAAMFFVRRDSKINSLTDLRGGSIAFQNPASTSAYYVPAYELLSRGMRLEILISPMDRPNDDAVGYVFARTERNIATWVVKGLVDVGVMSDLDWRDPARVPLNYRQELRPLHVSAQFPRAMELVSQKMKPAVRERLKQVLLDAEDDPAANKALEAFFGTTGFEPIDAQMRRELDYIDAAVTRVRKDVE